MSYLNIYNLRCPENTINKFTKGYSTLVVSYPNNFWLKDPTSFVNPIICVKLNDGVVISDDEQMVAPVCPYGDTSNNKGNYIVLSQWNTIPVSGNYFVRDVVFDRGVMYISCELDVLETYKTHILADIKDGKMICTQSGTINSADGQPLADDNVAIGCSTYADRDIIRFGNVLTWDNPYYVLTVAGSYGVFNSTN